MFKFFFLIFIKINIMYIVNLFLINNIVFFLTNESSEKFNMFLFNKVNSKKLIFIGVSILAGIPPFYIFFSKIIVLFLSIQYLNFFSLIIVIIVYFACLYFYFSNFLYFNKIQQYSFKKNNKFLKKKTFFFLFNVSILLLFNVFSIFYF